MPLAIKEEKALTVTTAVFPSAANHELPAPSSPEGHRMFSILLNCESDVDGEPTNSAFSNGIGTRDEENGVAPAEKGTLGLLVPFITVPLPPKEVMKEPAKKRLFAEELAVMESTRELAPDNPVNGGADHELALGSQTATDVPGDVNLPPNHTLPFLSSQ